MISRISRRTVFLTSIVATAISFFTLGVTGARRSDAAARASYEATLDSHPLRSEERAREGRAGRRAAGRDGGRIAAGRRRRIGARQMVAEIKEELQNEMGLVPVQLLRDRRSSFVELYSYDNLGKTNYGTAGYLGNGYFITVKHAVVALPDDDGSGERAQDRVDQGRLPRQGDSGEGRRLRATPTSRCTAATGRSSSTRELDLPALHADTGYRVRLRRVRSSGWATTTRRASSSRPATSASGRPTAW